VWIPFFLVPQDLLSCRTSFSSCLGIFYLPRIMKSSPLSAEALIWPQSSLDLHIFNEYCYFSHLQRKWSLQKLSN
jgi:hypothetical protein